MGYHTSANARSMLTNFKTTNSEQATFRFDGQHNVHQLHVHPLDGFRRNACKEEKEKVAKGADCQNRPAINYSNSVPFDFHSFYICHLDLNIFRMFRNQYDSSAATWSPQGKFEHSATGRLYA